MKKFLLSFVISFSFLTLFSQNQGFVHLEKKKLVDGNNQSIELNGVNLGGWLMWEGWIWGGGFSRETKVYNKMELLYGKETMDKFRKEVYKNYIQKADIKAISEMGFNSVRVPFNHLLFEEDGNTFHYKEEGFAIIDSLLNWCETYNVYAILDLHGTPGGQNGIFISDFDEVKLWDSDLNKKRTIALWYEIAKRYSNRKIVGGYDLINEPGFIKCNQLVDIYKSIIDTIRTVDKNHLIILEGKNFATSFSCFETVLDNNQIYSFHFYPWYKAKSMKRNTLKSHQKFSLKVGVPLWCGEWGEDKLKKLIENKSLMTDKSYNFCGNSFWTWKKVITNKKRTALNEVFPGEEWLKVIESARNSKMKKNEKYSEQALKDFLKAIKYENCKQNENLKSLLNRISYVF
jgi:aryl-phospho-beta-D-glucosidase BglC (GH1 family)